MIPKPRKPNIGGWHPPEWYKEEVEMWKIYSEHAKTLVLVDELREALEQALDIAGLAKNMAVCNGWNTDKETEIINKMKSAIAKAKKGEGK
jgi:hypothetical protein